MMKPATLSNHRPSATSSIDAVRDVLNVTSDYILETAYGTAYMTVSDKQMELSRRLALAVFASHVQPTHVSFTLDRDDLPSAAMTYTAFLLSKAWTLSAGECSPSNSLNLQANEADCEISRHVACSPYPPRLLCDCGYMRNRIAKVASTVKPQKSGAMLYRLLGKHGGIEFEHAASSLETGGAR